MTGEDEAILLISQDIIVSSNDSCEQGTEESQTMVELWKSQFTCDMKGEECVRVD